MRWAPAAALAAVALAGCGDEGDGPPSGGTPTQRTESPSLAPPAESTPEPGGERSEPKATAPSAPPPPLDATGPEERPGGAGDEVAARTRVGFVVDGEGLTPPRAGIPAFLALRITVRNDLPRRVVVALRGGHRAVRIRARSARGFDVDGLQPGRYRLDAGTAGRSTLLAR